MSATATPLPPAEGPIAQADIRFALGLLTEQGTSPDIDATGKRSLELVRMHLEAHMATMDRAARYAAEVKHFATWLQQFLVPATPAEATHVLSTTEIIAMLTDQRPAEHDTIMLPDALRHLGGQERFVGDRFVWHLKQPTAAVL